MTFSEFEISQAASRPIELYRFAIGNEVYNYTSSEDNQSFNAVQYVAIPIRRSTIIASPEDRNRVIEIALPSTNEFAALYRTIVPGQRASVTIFRLQREDADEEFRIIYKGFVKAANFDGDGQVAKISVMSAEASASRMMPTFTYQSLCNHMLYSTGCGAVANDHRHEGVVTSVDLNTIVVAGAGDFPSGTFAAGYLKPLGISDFRMILTHTGNSLGLLLPFPLDVVGQTVEVFAGCDHMVTGDCGVVFGRTRSFGGFPVNPTTNPFETGIAHS